MLETIGNLLGNIAAYIAAVLGLVALFFVWTAIREWRAGARAAFGIERDIATSEMIGAIGRAGVVVFVGLIVLGLGQLGQRVESEEETPVQASRTPLPTVSVFEDLTPESDVPAPTPVPSSTPLPAVTDVPPLPAEPTQASIQEPTQQTARVTAFGGLWLRDAPNGGIIGSLPLPQETIVQLLEGREFAGARQWQQVRVLNTPPDGQGFIGLEGWVAAEYLEAVQ